jgi:uncharacterized protein YndB with AHSA1/START domain
MEWTGAKYSDSPTVEVAIHIAASAERVWQLVADIEVLASLSDELQSVQWLDGVSAPRLGARFIGRSSHPSLGEWTTTSFVVDFDPPRVFAWAVEDPDVPSATWRFSLLQDGGGVELTQWAQLGPGRSGLNLAIDQMPEKEEKIVFVRLREFERAMERNLAQIKLIAEAD